MKKINIFFVIIYIVIIIMTIISSRDLTVLCIYTGWIMLYCLLEILINHENNERHIGLITVVRYIIIIILFVLSLATMDYYSVNDKPTQNKPEEVIESTSEIPKLSSGTYVRERVVVDGKVVKVSYRKIK